MDLSLMSNEAICNVAPLIIGELCWEQIYDTTLTYSWPSFRKAVDAEWGVSKTQE